MRRALETIPIRPSYVTNIANKPIYTRFHRKPQIYQDNYPTNQTYKIEKTFEQENMNNYLSNIYKEKKYRGVLDPAAPNNKNIFIDTDSEHHLSEREEGVINPKRNEKSAKLLIAKTESQYPETFNSQTIFRRDGLTKGYFVNLNGNNNLNYNNYLNFNNTYNTLTKKSKNVQSIINTPSQYDENKYIYNYNKGVQAKNVNNINQPYNKNTMNNGLFKKEIDLDEWPSVDRNKKAKLYYRNKDIQVSDKDNRNDSNNYNYQNNLYNKRNRIPGNIIYRKGNVSEIKASYSKSNISDISEDNLNQIRKQNEYNYILAGNTSGIASPIEYKNNNNFVLGTSEEESDPQGDFYGDRDYRNYMNKQIIKNDINNDISEHELGGRINLYYGIKNNNKDFYKGIRNKYIIKKDKNTNIIDTIKNDKIKYNALLKLQKAIKEYLYLREYCAMKIQAVWRGGNTRKIMELYNDLDEFIYHLSKVQFNHFNNNFCFFIKQLFNIYKTNVSNLNYDIEYNENNKEEEIENENENCINQISIEEIDKKEGTGSYFAPEKLELENEIALFVEGSSPYYERSNEMRIKENEDPNNINVNNRIVPKKEKNESESTIGSIKSDYKFHKFDKTGSNKKENVNKKSSEKKQKLGENGTMSNDYDADLDINRDDDYFNHDISYDDKDNSGSLIKDKRYSYFSIHSDENSKYFDNENPNEKENKEGDMYKINTSKNSSKYNNNSTKNTGITGYTGYSLQDKSKLIGFRTDKINKNEFSNSPSVEKSNNYIGHHSKTFPRKYKNYNEYINTTALIIPKHEEDFNIINNKMFLSPKVNGDQKHVINARSDIAVTPNMKFEDKNWNEIIEYIKNEEIEIPTQKNLKNIKKIKESRKFDILENEKINDINIDNKDYRDKKLSQIYIWHENELNIVKDRKNIGKEKSLLKEIDDKQNQIILFKKQLEDAINKLNQPKVFDSQLEVNNNLNSLNIKGKEKEKIIFTKINNEEINIRRKSKEIISLISKNNEFCIDQKMPEKVEAITDTSDLIPKQIKITTKKIVKKTDTIQYKFKNNLISSQNEININGREKIKPIFEEESQENNRFCVKNENKDNELLRVKILNPEDLKITSTISHIFSPLEGKKDQKEELKVILNNVISLNPLEKPREIKLVTKKVLKKTNYIHSKFNNDKAQISSTNYFDIKCEEKPQSKIELLSSEIDKLIKEEKLDQLPPELQSKIKILVVPKDKDIKEITKENTININGTGKKFENIQLQKEEDKNNNRFTFESIPNIIKVNKNQNLNKKYENVINKKSKFTINSVKKKPEENIINKKSKFTINGIQKKPIELKDEEIQYEQNKDYISEKMTDTFDLIPKEIKIVTKKITKKTNVIKKNINNTISHEHEIKFEGMEIPEKEKEKEKESIKTDNININQEIPKNKDWNKLLQKEGQQYNFVIKRISKNIYDQYKKAKDNKEIDDKKEEEKPDKKEKTKQKQMEKIVELPDEENIDREIKDKNLLKSKKENINKDNVIVKKINFNIHGQEVTQKDENKNEPQSIPKENVIYQSNWKDILKQDTQQDNFLINPDSDIKAKLEELDNIKKAQINKSENNIDKNIEINIEPIDTLILAKNKILDNWKELVSQDKSEELNVAGQPKKREIKIATKKITKKTNFTYKKFMDQHLAVIKNDLNIEGTKKEKKQPEYLTAKIHLNIDKSYEKKKLDESELEIVKNPELFINASLYKKKEIRINTKKTVAKTNYVYKRFNNNLISNENQIQIENIKSMPTIITSFGNDKLETVPIEENKFTINKTEDNKKENELKEKLQKEAETQIKKKLEEENKELQNKIINENTELKKENEELKNKIKKESEKKEENKEKEEKKEKIENTEPIAVEEFTINKKYNNKNETIENLKPLAIDDFTIVNQQNIENEKIEEKEEDKNNEENLENKEIHKNNEPMVVEEFTIIKEYNNKNETIKNMETLVIEDFTIENQTNKENDEYENKNKNYGNLTFDNIQFSIKKKPKKVSEQAVQIEEIKPEQTEKMTDTFDLEKREIRITNKKILKKTNVLRHEFKHNSICSDTQLSINKPSELLKERNNNIINKKICLTINNENKEKEIKDEPKINLEIKKNDELTIQRNKLNKANNNTINYITNIQLSNDEVQKPNEKLTEKTFGDIYQLGDAKLHKPIKLITDKNKLASSDDIITLNIRDNEKSDEEPKTILKKRKGMNTILLKGSNKKNKFENLVIKLDNKFELKNCFNKLSNNLTPNIYPKKGENINEMDKNKSLKQFTKEQDKKNLKLNNVESNERKSDILKSSEDLNTIPVTNTNFITINVDDKNDTLEPFSTKNITDENDNIKKLNIKLKPKSIKQNLNIPENNNIPDDNNDNNLVSISNNDDIKRQSINSKSIGSIDNNSDINFISMSNTSSIEINEKDSIDEVEQKNIEKPEEPKKKEIIIKKKICIISKNQKPKIKYAEAKKKFFLKRFLIKCWRIWKKNSNLIKEDDKENENMKSIDQKKTKKPFTLKNKKNKKIHKIIVDKEEGDINVEKEKYLELKNKIMSQNKMLIIRHFFLNWKKDKMNQNKQVEGISVIENILRRYIVRYLLMHGKIQKLKILLIKKIFASHKKTHK